MDVPVCQEFIITTGIHLKEIIRQSAEGRLLFPFIWNRTFLSLISQVINWIWACPWWWLLLWHHFFFLNISQYHLFCLRPDLQSSVWTFDFLWPQSLLVFSLLSLVNVMRCSVCHQDYKQSDIIDNYFVKDTTEATSTSDEKAAQVCRHGWFVCIWTSAWRLLSAVWQDLNWGWKF